MLTVGLRHVACLNLGTKEWESEFASRGRRYCELWHQLTDELRSTGRGEPESDNAGGRRVN